MYIHSGINTIAWNLKRKIIADETLEDMLVNAYTD